MVMNRGARVLADSERVWAGRYFGAIGMEAIPEEWLLAGSSRCQARPCPPQLEQVVRQADEVPLRGYLAQAAEGEATKSSSLFGRAKDRIDDRLAKFVDGVPLGTTNAPLEHARYGEVSSDCLHSFFSSPPRFSGILSQMPPVMVPTGH